MVAPLNVARLGGGGISIPVGFDTAELKAQGSQIRQDVAAFEKGLKLTPKVDWDWQEVTAKREMKRIILALERDAGKVRVALEMDPKMAWAAARAGHLSAAQVAALRPLAQEGYDDTGLNYNTSRAHRVTGFNADVRRNMSAQLRGERARRYDADVHNETLRRTAREGYDDTGMIHGPAERPSRMSRLMEGAQMFRMALTGTLADTATAAALGGVRAGRGAGMMFGSGDPMLRMQGGAQMMDGAGSIPVVGNLIRAFDTLAGITSNLNLAMKARADVEDRVVRMAQMGGDPVAIASAQGRMAMLAIQRDMGQTSTSAASMAGGAAGQYMMGTLAGQSANAAGQTVENTMMLDLAHRQRTAVLRGAGARGETSFLSANLQPMGAARAALMAELKTGLETAPAFMRDNPLAGISGVLGGMGNLPDMSPMGMMNSMVMGAFNQSQARDIRLAKLHTASRVGASELRVRNRGQLLDDESTLGEIQGIRGDLISASNDPGFGERAQVEALSRARALKAGLAVRGGDTVYGGFNLKYSRVGDPLGLIPEVQARSRAQLMANGFIQELANGAAATGGSDDYAGRAGRIAQQYGNMNAGMGDSQGMTPLLAEAVDILSEILGALGARRAYGR